MESRFGRDFSRVRTHTDARSAESARAVSAEAYTVGSDIVFGSGRYAPETPSGRRLIAHELAHTIQQGGGAGATGALPIAVQPCAGMRGDLEELDADRAADAALGGGRPIRLGSTGRGLQRKCGKALGPPQTDCAQTEAGVVGWQFLFKVACDDLLPGQESNLARIKPNSKVNVHGFASLEGDPDFNMELSCHRARRLADLVGQRRPDCQVVEVFKHGASPQPQPGAVPDLNPPRFWRSATVEEIRPAISVAPLPNATCGPDATDWLVSQIAAGKTNAKVLSVKKHLDNGAFFAPAIGSPAFGLDSMDILEGGVAVKVGKAWEAAGKPQATPEANAQLGQAAPSVLAFQAAGASALGLDLNAITTLQELRAAALEWKALVGTGMKYDFKNGASTMSNPKSPKCPGTTCPSTITLCAGSAGLNCFGKDLPGNLFYATIGRFVGFSENALQLGSEFAQLTSKTKSWDPPEDPVMISLGFALPPSLTRTTLCAALQGIKATLPPHQCVDCPEQSSASVVNP
jgi:uncharacterized protein DUF4157/putative RNase toxin 44 of polymorphic toxin system